MRRWTEFCLAAAACLLAGCNQPAVALKPPAFQSSENTVRDWNAVAYRIAAEMAWRGLLPPAYGQPEPPIAVPPPVVPPPAVFVRVLAPDSAFLREVADTLEADILNRGGAIARAPAGATVVNLDVDFVQWSPRDKPPGLLGTTVAVAAIPGIVLGAAAPMSPWAAADAATWTALGLGAFSDLVIALTPTSNAEAVWKATIMAEDRLIMKLQEPVYIRDRDIPLYAKAAQLTPITSWAGEDPPLAARRLRYDP